jgi:putative transcriptional regulator
MIIKDFTPLEIKELRLKLGMTQAEFSEAIGLERQQTISVWEKGEQLPSRMAKILLTMFLSKVEAGEYKLCPKWAKISKGT